MSGLSSKLLRLAAALAATCSYAGLAAESKWIHLRSANFELYSSAGPRSARDTIRQFEQVRAFFIQAFGGPPRKPISIRLVAFGSAKEYEAYKLNDFATAYYHQTPDRDYVVMSRGAADIFPVAVHEYVHLLVQHEELKLPPWLNEGLAEVYSTLRPIGDKILIGDLIRGRHQALLANKWTPLATILAAGRDSPYYNEKNKAGSLYNEGWALTHMLCFRAEYRPKFGDLIRMIAAGKDSIEALQEIFGRPLAPIEKDLQVYLRGASFHGVLVSAKLEKTSDEIPADPLPDFDRDLMLADLNYRSGKEAERKSALEKLVAADPSRPEPYRGLAYLAIGEDHRAEAIQLFGKAFDRGDHDSKLLWDYGRLLESSRGEEAIRVLAELLAKQPERTDVRVELAEAQVRADQAKAALATLAPIRTVTPADSARFFRVAVYAHLRNGDQRSAEGTARRFRELAKTDSDRAGAEELLRLVERRQMAEVRLASADTLHSGTAESTPPHLRRKPPAGVARSEAAPELAFERHSIAGRFVELQCKGSQAHMVIETADGRRVLLIEDPNRVAITAGAQGPVDMACGVQKKAVKIEIGFERRKGMPSGIDGIVTSMAF